MAFAAVPHTKEHLRKFFLIPFFTVHYGIFTAAHGFIVFAIFNKYGGRSMEGTNLSLDIKIALLALFISHGISFVYNYLLKREFASANPIMLMVSPYGRVIIMHIALVAGAFFVMILGSPATLLLILVVLKTIVDINLHLRGHKKARSKIVN